MVLNSVVSKHSKRNYTKALDETFALCANRSRGHSRALLMAYRAAMVGKKLSASTVNVRLSAACKLVAEARRRSQPHWCSSIAFVPPKECSPNSLPQQVYAGIALRGRD